MYNRLFLAFLKLILYNRIQFITNLFIERIIQMRKTKRIAAIIGLILIVALLLITLISSFFPSGPKNQLFSACIFTLIALPIMIYAYMMIYKLVHRKDNQHLTDEEVKDENTVSKNE